MKLSKRRISLIQIVSIIALTIILWEMFFLVFYEKWVRKEHKEITQIRCKMVVVEREIQPNKYFGVEYWVRLNGTSVRKKFLPSEIYLISDKFLQYDLAQCLWQTGIISENILYSKKDLNLDEIYEDTNPTIFVMTDEDSKKVAGWEKSEIPEFGLVYADPKHIEKWYDIRQGDIKERLKEIKWGQCEEFYKPCFISLRNGKLDVKVWQFGQKKAYQIPYLSEADLMWKFLIPTKEEGKYIEFSVKLNDSSQKTDFLNMLYLLLS